MPTKRCMRARKLAALELAKWLRENLLPRYFGSPCVPLSACQMSRPQGVMVTMCPPVGPPGVTAAMCRPARCQGRYVSPCWPARCHGRRLSPVGPLGVTDAMCRSQVSRTPCVPCRPTTCQDRYVSPCRYARCHGCHVSFHQVSRPPCVGPPSIGAPCVGPQGVTGACVRCQAAKPYLCAYPPYLYSCRCRFLAHGFEPAPPSAITCSKVDDTATIVPLPISSTPPSQTSFACLQYYRSQYGPRYSPPYDTPMHLCIATFPALFWYPDGV